MAARFDCVSSIARAGLPALLAASEARDTKRFRKSFRLAFTARGLTKGALFETDGPRARLYHHQMSGNPVRIGDGCATVTGYKLPQATARKSGKAGARPSPESGYRSDSARHGSARAGPASPTKRRMRPARRTVSGGICWMPSFPILPEPEGILLFRLPLVSQPQPSRSREIERPENAFSNQQSAVSV